MERNREVDFVNTGNCGFRRELILRQPFNENLHWLEDIELSFRLAATGACLIFVPEARVEHLHPDTLLAYFRRKYRCASLAPAIYRAFPGKAFSDSGNSFVRRFQLFLFSLILPAGLWSPILGMSLLVTTLLLSTPLILEAARKSLVMGAIAPLFVLVGTAGTTAGFVRGLFQPAQKVVSGTQVSA